MQTDFSKIDFHNFVKEKLSEKGFKISVINEEMMKKRVDDFMDFVNNIRNEYKHIYNWNKEKKEYFLDGLKDKWKYSFAILNEKDELCFINFTSVYYNKLHNHCSYTRKDMRSLKLAKLHSIKVCQTGLENGFTKYEGFWPIKNNGSVILYLKMGWEIESMRNNSELYMTANLEYVRNKTYELILTGG